jgi:hypothetical protein
MLDSVLVVCFLKYEATTLEEVSLATGSPLGPLLGSAGAGGCCRGEFPLEFQDAHIFKSRQCPSLEVDIGQWGVSLIGIDPVKSVRTGEALDVFCNSYHVLVMNNYNNTIAYFAVFVKVN